MTLQQRLTEAHVRAMRLYLRRQDVETQQQALAQQSRALDMALIKSDGEVATLEALIAAEQGVPDGV